MPSIQNSKTLDTPFLEFGRETAQLYKAIYQVRQALAVADPACPPDTLLELSDELIRLTASNGVHTDISMFELLAQEAIHSGDLHRLQRAVACYKGDLLPADRYEEWTLTYREMLRERFIDVLVNLGRCYQKVGYLAEAADAFRQALDRDKLREDARRGLMRVYALQGSRTRALRQSIKGGFPMPKYLIERNIPNAGQLSPKDLCTVSQQSNGVLKEMTQNGSNVQWLHSYGVDDALYCVYIAADPETVREHAHRGGFPADKINTVREIIDPTTGE